MVYDDIFKEINAATANIDAASSAAEKQLAQYLNLLVKQLEVDANGNIVMSADNLKIIANIKSKLHATIESPAYQKSVADYLKAFDKVVEIQNAVYGIEPLTITKILTKTAKDAVINRLTGDIMDANVVEGVQEVLRKGITSGTSYEGLQKQLADFVGEGYTTKYFKQVSTDAINQFSRQYSSLLAADLGLTWFRYAGTNIDHTRPFCLACTDRRYFNIKEIPDLLKGDFPEFAAHDGKIYEKTGLPAGMYPETDAGNFDVLLGGYNCGHQYRPISDSLVPDKIMEAFLLRYKK